MQLNQLTDFLFVHWKKKNHYTKKYARTMYCNVFTRFNVLLEVSMPAFLVVVAVFFVLQLYNKALSIAAHDQWYSYSICPILKSYSAPCQVININHT